MLRGLTLAAVLLLLASPEAAAQKDSDCLPAPIDSTASDSVRNSVIFFACQVDREARQRGTARVRWTPMPGEMTTGSCYKVTLKFVIDTLGRAEDGTIVVLSSTHHGLESAVLETVPQMRFEPARYRKQKVRQLVEHTHKAQIATAVVRSSGGGPPAMSRPMPTAPRC